MIRCMQCGRLAWNNPCRDCAERLQDYADERGLPHPSRPIPQEPDHIVIIQSDQRLAVYSWHNGVYDIRVIPDEMVGEFTVEVTSWIAQRPGRCQLRRNGHTTVFDWLSADRLPQGDTDAATEQDRTVGAVHSPHSVALRS